MTTTYFKPAADAPGVFTSEPAESRQGDRFRAVAHGQTALLAAEIDPECKAPDPVVSTRANPGFDEFAFSLSRIWAAAKDLAGRAWDEIDHVLTDDGGGGGARIPVSSDDAEIVMTARAPALLSPRT